MSVHVLGIRHHGPGSARNVLAYLSEIKPDIVLVEGPPEADEVLSWTTNGELKPPVAILCYQPDDPQHSVFYPFAEFSPEWQAISFAKQNNIPVRFFDLPVSNQLAIEKQAHEKAEAAVVIDESNSGETTIEAIAISSETVPPEPVQQYDTKTDPISYLAEAAGYADGEKWWEQMFEYRQNNEQVFDAVSEAMQTLRDNLKPKEDRLEKLREAYMRKMIRQAEREMYSSIAVVCGAWHAPALINMGKQKDDNELLKNLPKVKIETTWIPWTYNRLSYYSGYGAGIHSPGWYAHIWHFPNDDGTRWMSKIAHLFRTKGMDTSVAHVIEAVRLAETLSSLRGHHKAGLEELNEATLSVLCNGENILLRLINDELIVSHTIGAVPADIPKPPLQLDIEKQQKTLRLPITADFKDYTIDLRKEMDLGRSIFLHRLRLIGIQWGTQSGISGKGTFKEQWRLQWDPAFAIDIIDKGSWGNTVEVAANSFVMDKAAESKSILQVAQLLQEALPAALETAVEALINSLNNLSAASGDVVQLMEAVPPLADIVRYGNVRNTNSAVVLNIVRSMCTRIAIGLPNAVSNINEDAAAAIFPFIQSIKDAIALLQQEDITQLWQQSVEATAHAPATAPVISGYATRLLYDYTLLEGDALVKLFHYRMSSAVAANLSAAWLEGFLKGSGTVLLVDEGLWQLVNSWVAQLEAAQFTEVLPLLRRTFSTFTSPERRKIGERAKAGNVSPTNLKKNETDFDADRGKLGIPVVMTLLGY
jgi:hypothetical protein